MKKRYQTFSVNILLLFICYVAVYSINFAQSIETVATNAGELTLERSEDWLFQVKLGERVLFESTVKTGEVQAKFPQNKPTLVVLGISEQALACAGYSYVVDVSGRKPKMTEAFGNCNPAPKISYRNRTITIKFPDGRRDRGAYKYGAAETWQYANGKLKRIR